MKAGQSYDYGDTNQLNTAQIAFYNSDKTTVVQEFTFKELANATQNFSLECLVGEGSFGKVYRGKLQETGEIVAVKKLNLDGLLGHREFLVQVMMMSLFNHPNLVNLIGYCVEGEERILVHEYLPMGSLHHYLHDRSPKQKPPLDWYTRIRIALGVARGLECIHQSSPPIIHLNLKPSNVLLDCDFNAKLSNFKLAKIEPFSDKRINLEKVMLGAHDYFAPEDKITGLLTVKTDVYSFGVVLLELISGRRAVDLSRPSKEQNLVTWSQQRLNKPNKFPELADPLLQCEFPVKGFNQALAIAAKCLREEPSARPMMSDVVANLMCLTTDNYNGILV
ncbi:probable serine/threonine-protein kinase PBL24 [Chenopodium quinoa]|uniref:probable serine/threonine-protein kinase PBL24 n=1 Tax=Chenopodium quinoa TaxID=63459 RepID=UPI000B77901A|nr:probable serine/threonine-protein kinase PBL24 [Chenopodium quinoa]